MGSNFPTAEQQQQQRSRIDGGEPGMTLSVSTCFPLDGRTDRSPPLAEDDGAACGPASSFSMQCIIINWSSRRRCLS